MAAGLIPERDIDGLERFDIESGEGPVYLAGNVSHIHDLADGAAQEGARMGVAAARNAFDEAPSDFELPDVVSRLLDIPVAEGAALSCADAEEWKSGSTLRRRCTGCPASCEVTVFSGPDGAARVEGCACDRGEDIVISALKNPERTFTGTLKCARSLGRELLPVRSSAPVAVNLLADVAKAARGIEVAAPALADEVVARNVGGLGVDLVASCATDFSHEADSGDSRL